MSGGSVTPKSFLASMGRTSGGGASGRQTSAGRTSAARTSARRTSGTRTSARPTSAGRTSARPTSDGQTSAKRTSAGRTSAKPTSAGRTSPAQDSTYTRPRAWGRSSGSSPSSASPVRRVLKRLQSRLCRAPQLNPALTSERCPGRRTCYGMTNLEELRPLRWASPLPSWCLSSPSTIVV